MGRILGGGEPAAENPEDQGGHGAAIRKPWLAALVVAGSVLAISGFSGAKPAASTGWAKAHFIGGAVKPGAMISMVSCSSPGNCTGGGTDSVQYDALAADVYVVTETNGTWGKGVALPGWTELNQGDQSSISQISCSSAGNCGVAGAYSAKYDFGFEYT